MAGRGTRAIFANLRGERHKRRGGDRDRVGERIGARGGGGGGGRDRVGERIGGLSGGRASG
jgi:hypothetical protein